MIASKIAVTAAPLWWARCSSLRPLNDVGWILPSKCSLPASGLQITGLVTQLRAVWDSPSFFFCSILPSAALGHSGQLFSSCAFLLHRMGMNRGLTFSGRHRVGGWSAVWPSSSPPQACCHHPIAQCFSLSLGPSPELDTGIHQEEEELLLSSGHWSSLGERNSRTVQAFTLNLNDSVDTGVLGKGARLLS